MTFERMLLLALRWFILAAAVWAAAEVLPGIHLEGWGSTLAVAAILGLLNLSVRPVLVLLSLPATVLSLGLFLIVINAIFLELTDWIAGGFDSVRFNVDSFGSALLGALIISLVGHLIGLFVQPRRLAREVSGRR